MRDLLVWQGYWTWNERLYSNFIKEKKGSKKWWTSKCYLHTYNSNFSNKNVE